MQDDNRDSQVFPVDKVQLCEIYVSAIFHLFEVEKLRSFKHLCGFRTLPFSVLHLPLTLAALVVRICTATYIVFMLFPMLHRIYEVVGPLRPEACPVH